MIRFDENNQVVTVYEYNAILVGLEMNEDLSYYMEELAGLAEAAGVKVLGQMIQKAERPNNATYIGKGKVEELSEYCENMECDLVIFNDELTGIQIRNLEERLDLRVIDRTILILDIFASRAVTKEGKLQVELAQLQYRMPRLTGFGKSLAKLRAGVGARGPGEKKLETDRRHIVGRMDEIKKEIAEIKHTRSTQRARRQKSEIPVVALVGYTNSGKSALMNRFLRMSDREEKTVFEKDMLFASLDTFQRKIKLDNKKEFVLIDTVGFVSKLPHSLVQAFKSTLEEVVFADLLLHVVDASFEGRGFHMKTTNQVLKEIGAEDKEKIIVYNKMDLVENLEDHLPDGHEAVYVSAKTGLHIKELQQEIVKKIFSQTVKAEMLIPYNRGDISSYFCGKYTTDAMEYREEGTYMMLELSQSDFQKYEEFSI